MAEQYVDRLGSGMPEQRRAVIVKLGKAGDPGAISLLGALFGFGLQCFSAARAHEFGFFKGFGAVVIGGFAFGVLSVIVGLGSAFNPGR